MSASNGFPLILTPSATLGGLRTPDEAPILPDGTWYEADEPEDGLLYEFEPGALAAATHVTCDVLLEGSSLGVFAVRLHEGGDGRTFTCHFGFLNQCQARMRMPLEAVEQNRWMFPREGAWLKVLCSGDRVDLTKVDRLTFICFRKGDGPVRWCMTPLRAVAKAPPLLSAPLLPTGPLLD